MIQNSLLSWLISFAVILFPVIVPGNSLFLYAQDEANPTTEEADAPEVDAVVDEEVEPAGEGAEDKEKKETKLIPDYMTLTKELMTEIEHEELFHQLKAGNYSRILSRGTRGRQEDKIIDDWAKWHIYGLTLKKNEKFLAEKCEEIRKEIRSAGFSLPQGNARSQFKEHCIEQLLVYAKDLLDGNFYVRLNLAILLGRLNIQKASLREHAIPCPKAGDLLADIIEDPKQPIPVKLEAALSLRNIGYYGNPDPAQKFRFSEVLIKELQSPGNAETHFWYQNSLLSSLASMDQILDLNRKATILQTLTAVLVDSNRPWIVRSVAAKSIGRAKKDGSINIKLLCFEILNTTRAMAAAYNQNPEAKDWKWCFFYSYLAYQMDDATEDEIPRKIGLKNQTGTDEYVDGSYFQLLKMVNHMEVFSDDRVPAFPDSMLSEVDTWLKENQPVDRRIAPGMDPIVSSEIPSVKKQETAKSSSTEEASRTE